MSGLTQHASRRPAVYDLSVDVKLPALKDLQTSLDKLWALCIPRKLTSSVLCIL